MSDLTSVKRRVGSSPAPEILKHALLLCLDTEGEATLARRLGLHPHTIIKLATGRPVWRATVIAAATKLGVDLAGVEVDGAR